MYFLRKKNTITKLPSSRTEPRGEVNSTSMRDVRKVERLAESAAVRYHGKKSKGSYKAEDCGFTDPLRNISDFSLAASSTDP